MRKPLLQLFIVIGVSFIISCEKEEESFPPVTSTEKNIIQLPDGGNLVTKALEIANTVMTYDILTVHRETRDAGELNKTQVVKIAKSNSILSDFTGAAVKELPRDYYQNHPDNPFDGEFWTITFKPGEHTKYLKLNLRTLAVSSLGRVGLGFRIAEAPNAQISGTLNQVAVEISAKNQWDGVYSYVGSLNHPTACISGPVGTPTTGGTIEITLITSGQNTVVRSMFGIENFVYWDNCAQQLGYFLNVIPEYQINADNSVTILSRPGSTVTWIAGSPLNYNPATKTFTLNYGYAGTPNRVIQETMVYLRPR